MITSEAKFDFYFFTSYAVRTAPFEEIVETILISSPNVQ